MAARSPNRKRNPSTFLSPAPVATAPKLTCASPASPDGGAGPCGSSPIPSTSQLHANQDLLVSSPDSLVEPHYFELVGRISCAADGQLPCRNVSMEEKTSVGSSNQGK